MVKFAANVFVTVQALFQLISANLKLYFFNTATVNNYGNGIAKILFGIGTPEEVYLECKKALQEEEETKYESFQDITEEKATCSTTWSSRFLRNTIIGYHK